MNALGTNVVGMSRITGRWLSGFAHLQQSIADILTTPLGSRVCARDYGSDLPNLIDVGMNEAGAQSLMAATVMAIARDYPSLSIARITLTQGDDAGVYSVNLFFQDSDGLLAANGQASLSIPLNFSAQVLN
jgi:uncharacterized protein